MIRNNGTSWADRLSAAHKRGKFLSKDLTDAMDWTKCAVGEWRGNFVADADNCPTGTELYNLGHTFLNAVEDNDVNEATKTYQKIQGYMQNNIRRRKNPLTKSMAMRSKIKIV